MLNHKLPWHLSLTLPPVQVGIVGQAKTGVERSQLEHFYSTYSTIQISAYPSVDQVLALWEQQ